MNTNLTVHFSSKCQQWRTPAHVFNRLNQEFHFDLDAAADEKNHLCEVYFSQENSALDKNWVDHGKPAFLNPPYGREIGKFVKKAYDESKRGCRSVILMPSRTCSKYFHNYCMKAKEIRFFVGRLKFVNPAFPSYREDGNFKVSPAPFPSCLVIFDGQEHERPVVSSISAKE